MVLAYIPAIAIGVWVFGRLESPWLTFILGTVILLIIGAESLAAFGHLDVMVRRHVTVIGPVLAGISGLLAGVIGAGGIILVSLYAKIVCANPRMLRATILLIANFVIFWRTAVLGIGGFITLSLLIESLILVPVSFFGGFIGAKIFGRLQPDLLFRLFQGLLLVAAAVLVFKGLRGVL